MTTESGLIYDPSNCNIEVRKKIEDGEYDVDRVPGLLAAYKYLNGSKKMVTINTEYPIIGIILVVILTYIIFI